MNFLDFLFFWLAKEVAATIAVVVFMAFLVLLLTYFKGRK